MKIGIFGQGRLAQAVVAAAAERDVQVLWQCGRSDAAPVTDVDVAIDASTAEAVSAHVGWAIAGGVPLVIGATGWSLPDLSERVGRSTGVMVAPNFSLAVALMRRLAAVVARFAALDETRDPFVVESHHRHKTDAPSGTARALIDTVLAACPRKTDWVIGGPVADHELSVGVTRSGAERGTHVVGFDAPGEILEVRHVARSREIFGEGALAAATWLLGRTGVYRFDDMAAELLDPLFRSQTDNGGVS